MKIDVQHTDFVEEILTGDYYSYYVVSYRSFLSEKDRVAFISIDFDRKIHENKGSILLSEYRKASKQYINCNILFWECPPFQVQHISPEIVKTWFKVSDKANELIKEHIGVEADIYTVAKSYSELLKEDKNENKQI